MSLSRERVRALRILAQGLPPRPRATVKSALEGAGLVRTLGGVEVYLALRARVPGLGKSDLEAAVARGDARVSPSVRGCIYLVDRSQVPLALGIAGLLSRARMQREADKAGLEQREIERVGEAVLELLQGKKALGTDALKKQLSPGVVRSLGERGKKVGLSSNLPHTLRVLELDGLLERAPEDGRLDHERYLWRRPAASPLGSLDPEEVHAAVAELYFRAAGVGTRKELACWSGLGLREASAAADRVELVPVEAEGVEGPAFMLAAHRGLLEKDASEAVALLPYEDNLLALAGGPASLVDPACHDVEVPAWGGPAGTLGTVRHLGLRTLVAEGRIAGVWEYDPDTHDIAWAALGAVRPATRERIDKVASETARFLAEDLGHGRSFSLDTDDALRERVALVRARLGTPRARRTKKTPRRE